MRAKTWCALAFVASVSACATGLLPQTDDDASTSSDATVKGDGAACPQFDLQTDPQHCGSCTNACSSGQVCSAGSCNSSCQSPTTKCTSSDGGITCANLVDDSNHCGTCNNACSVADGGGVTPGSNNPADPGVVYDSGVGWTTGSPGCDASACAVTCPQGFTACSDGLCYDTQNHHDHCGACSTACTAQEWCNRGSCCALGQESCNGSCVDVLSNKANCGACGNACSGATPNCANGVCTATCSPTGTRQPFNTLVSKTATGCSTFQSSPCATATYNWSSNNIQGFANLGENIVCGGTTACISHVGINNWATGTECQGTWDVYCDATKVGTIATENKSCTGSPMSNGCSITFAPMTCSTIKFQITAAGGGLCCTGAAVDSSIAGVTAW
ncbi:MAG TPA: hypothetical protein VGH28_03965 [Polyangiaceae bacterium]|jgi:hypothetical protein